MDISLLDNIREENRSSPYQGKYLYKAEFYLPGARKTMYNRNMEEFNSAVARAKEEAESYIFLRRSRMELEWIDAINHQHIEHFLQVRQEFRKQRASGVSNAVKTNHYSDTVRVLANDPQYFAPLLYPGFRNLKIFKSLHDGNREVMWFNSKPKTKYRLYLKSKRVNVGVREHINSIIECGEDLYPSEALKWWLNMKSKTNNSYQYYWVSSNFNIGFNHDATYTLLQLSLDTGIVGKYYELRQR